MNESEIEKALRAHSPRRPSDALARRIEAALSAPAEAAESYPDIARQSAWWPFFRSAGWAAAGAAAAVAVLFIIGEPFPPREAKDLIDSAPEAAAVEFQAAESATELVSASAEELIYRDTAPPAQRVRITFLERHAWRNPATGAFIEMEVPREDVRLIPVAMQ